MTDRVLFKNDVMTPQKARKLGILENDFSDERAISTGL